MAWYNTGTIALTNGSATVTGSGTNFLVGAQIGEALYAPDGKLYEIQTINSATVITLASNYLGSTASGQDYQIIPTQSLVADLASDVTDLISDFADVRDYAGNGKFNDGAVGTPGITFTQDQDNGLYRIGSNNWALAAGGIKQVDLSATDVEINYAGVKKLATSASGIDVAGTGTFSGAVTVNGGNAVIGTGGGGNGLGALISKGAIANFYEAYDGTKTMIAGTDASNDFVKIGSLSAHPVGFVVGNGEKMRIDASGHAIIPAGVTLGTATGVYAAANTLDDYEEGTFTPITLGSTTAGTGTYGFQSGSYTKVGNLVTVNIYVDTTAHTGTGSLRVGGLPFTVKAGSNQYAAASFGELINVTKAADTIISGYTLPTTTSISINQITTGTTEASTSVLSMDGLVRLLLTVTYQT